MKKLSAGDLRYRVTLQAPRVPPALDSYGQPVEAWDTLGTYWARIRPLSGREAQVALQTKAEATHAVTMRYLGRATPLNPTMQLVFNGRVFGIVQVLNIEEYNWQYELVCQEIQVSGKV
jgi:SPP1 family predicted phage head-tail adaptor